MDVPCPQLNIVPIPDSSPNLILGISAGERSFTNTSRTIVGTAKSAVIPDVPWPVLELG